MIKRRDIGDYMRRWILDLPFGFMLRLHHIQLADEDPELHGHPFWFVSLVLRGWYFEIRPLPSASPTPGGSRVATLRTVGTIAYRPADCAHRIARVSPGGAWTLVLSRRVRTSWGFWTEDGRVDWRTFHTRKPGVIVNHGSAP